MNLVLRSLTAAGITLKKTGATQQSQAQAQATQNSAAFNANLHPRGADGTFITTGGTVQVLGGPDGKTPVAEGTATIITTNQGPLIQVKNPTTGQVTTVAPSAIQAAPQSIATLSAKGTQGIPTNPTSAASAGRSDGLNGIPPRSGKDTLGQQASPALMAAYMTAYKAGEAQRAKVAANKARVAANKVLAAQKKAAAAAKAAAKKAAAANKAPSTSANKKYYK